MGKTAAAQLPDGRVQVWFVINHQLVTLWKESRDPDADFEPLQNFPWHLAGETPTEIAAGTLVDGRVQLWALTSNHNLVTNWKVSMDPDSDWNGWEVMHRPPGTGGEHTKLVDLTVGRISDGRPQIFALSEDGQVWTFWRKGDEWSDWQLLSPNIL